MDRALKIGAVAAVSLLMAGCGTIQNALPFNLGRGPDADAVASAGERIPVIAFDQSLAPSAALAGRDFFLPGPQAAVSWPSAGGAGDNSVQHVIAARDFTVGWRRKIGVGAGNATRIMSPPVADGGRVFVLDGESTVSAVDARNGSVVWRTDVRPEGRERGGFGGGVAVSAGRVFVGSGYPTMTALDAATGAVVWRTAVDSPIHGAPTVAGARVYVVDVDNQILAFDTATGQQVWSYRGIVEPARIMLASSPAVTGDTVIAPFSSGELLALRASNGQPLWQRELSRTSRTSALSEVRDIAGRPVVSGGFVYSVSHSGVMAAVDSRSGQPLWQTPVSGVQAPLPVGDVVYVVSKAGELSVLNRQDGRVYWTRDLNEGRIRQEGGFLGFFDRTVRPSWAGPILASNRLILVNSDGEAVALNPKTGETLATLRVGGAMYVSPIAYDGALIVITDDGELVSIR